MSHLLSAAAFAAAAVLAPLAAAQVVPAESPAVGAAEDAMSLRQSPGLQIANAYGLPHWGQIDRIEWTFNAQLPGRDTAITRRWTWQPTRGVVTAHREGGDIELLLVPGTSNLRVGQDLGEQEIEAHKQFINDHYWLLFPFQLVWSGPQLTEHGEQPLPIGEGSARKVTVQYSSDGGYTPGDAYDLYLTPEHRIVQWVFRRGGGPAEKGSPATWEGNVELGPIVVSTEHRNADDSFRLWFTDVKAVVRDESGKTAQHTPKPIGE